MHLNLNDFYWFGFTKQQLKFVDGDYNFKASPMINGKEVSLDDAIKKVLEIFEKDKLVHFDGLICDLKSLNKILDLAEIKRSSVNHSESDETNNFYSAYQKYGGSFLSFNELKKRSDLLIFLGDFENSQIKSFLKNIGWSKNLINNLVFLLSEKKSSQIKNNFNFRGLDELTKLILDLFRTKTIEKKYQKLSKKLRVSKYPVFIINTKNGFMITDQILKTCEYINNNLRKIRIFRFSGLNNSSGFVNSAVTKTGYPGALKFTDWGVLYDPEEYRSEIQKKLVNTQIFFSNLNSNPAFVKFKKNIFIGHPNFKYKKEFDIFIPVKTPGLDTSGLVVRSDGCGLLKLKSIAMSEYTEIYKLINLIMKNNG